MAVIKFNFLSKYLGMQTNITICLPTFSFADVINGTKETYVKGMKFQTMYLLHGGSGDDSDYVNFSNIVRYADDNKLAVVMPCDYNADYTDDPKGPRYLKYLTDELPLVCQSLFPMSDKREDNYIAGLSMGSHGAMKIALMYPERFKAALIMSGAARHPDYIGAKIPFKEYTDPDIMPMRDMTELYGSNSSEFSQTEHNAYNYARKNVEQGKLLPQFYFACGEDDFALVRAKRGYQELTDLGYKTSMEIIPGYKHEWDFWDLILRKAINEWLPIKREVIFP
jgi:S-formylglutathione hydrolase FrmB